LQLQLLGCGVPLFLIFVMLKKKRLLQALEHAVLPSRDEDVHESRRDF
jgi:hypothetical protein